MDKNKVLGLLLEKVLNDAIQYRYNDHIRLHTLRTLHNELAGDTRGFIDRLHPDMRLDALTQLNSVYTYTDPLTLKAFVIDKVDKGFMLTINGLESVDGSEVYPLPELGKWFASYLLGVVLF